MFNVLSLEVERILVIPDVGVSGTVFQVLLCGYNNVTTAKVYLYRLVEEDNTWNKLTSVNVQISSGQGSFVLRSSPEDDPGHFALQNDPDDNLFGTAEFWIVR